MSPGLARVTVAALLAVCVGCNHDSVIDTRCSVGVRPTCEVPCSGNGDITVRVTWVSDSPCPPFVGPPVEHSCRCVGGRADCYAGGGPPHPGCLPPAPTWPELDIAEESVAFGQVPVGSSSGAVVIVIGNVGDGQSGRVSFQLDGSDPGAFTMESDECTGLRLAPGESCAASVRMMASDARAFSAVLRVTDGDVSDTVLLEGRGVRIDAGVSDAGVSEDAGPADDAAR